MELRESNGSKIFRGMNTIFMWMVILVTLYPLLYVFMASVSEPNRFTAHRGILLAPLGFQWNAYVRVFQNPAILSGFKNTIFYVVCGTAVNLFMTSIGAYVLSLRKLMLNKLLMKFVIFTMFFSGGLIPMYLLIKNLGMVNSPFALIIPSAIWTWNLLVMRTSFMAVPESLIESAKIDGANDLVILFRIMLPLSLPILVTMLLYYGVGHWNAWFSAMIYLRDRNLYPVQLILREILIVSNTNSMTTDISMDDQAMIGHTIQHATTMVVTIPIVLVYPFLQKYFIKGIMIGAVKG